MIKLRQFSDADGHLLVKYLNDHEMTRYITSAIPEPYTDKDAKWWIEHSHHNQLIQAIEYQGCLVGCISAQRGAYEYQRSAEIGYWVAKDYWNHNFATLALQQFSQWLFEETDIVRLTVSVIDLNKASIRVLEKNQFVFEGTKNNASWKNNTFYNEQLWAKIAKGI